MIRVFIDSKLSAPRVYFIHYRTINGYVSFLIIFTFNSLDNNKFHEKNLFIW